MTRIKDAAKKILILAAGTIAGPDHSIHLHAGTPELKEKEIRDVSVSTYDSAYLMAEKLVPPRNSLAWCSLLISSIIRKSVARNPFDSPQ